MSCNNLFPCLQFSGEKIFEEKFLNSKSYVANVEVMIRKEDNF